MYLSLGMSNVSLSQIVIKITVCVCVCMHVYICIWWPAFGRILPSLLSCSKMLAFIIWHIKHYSFSSFSGLQAHNSFHVLQDGGSLPRPKTGLTFGNELSEETHVLTKQEILLGKGTQVESSRVKEPRRTAPGFWWYRDLLFFCTNHDIVVLSE